MEASVMIGFGIMVLVMLLIALGIGVTIYVLECMAAYRLAKRRNMENAWLSWLPVGREYILGKMSDDIGGEDRQADCRWRIWYPAAAGVYTLFQLILFVFNLTVLPEYTNMLLESAKHGSAEIHIPIVGQTILSNSAAVSILGLFTNLVSIALAVIGSILLYRVYKRYMPGAALAFAICGGIFGLHWLFLFIIRNRQPVYLVYPQNPYGNPNNYNQPPYNGWQ